MHSFFVVKNWGCSTPSIQCNSKTSQPDILPSATHGTLSPKTSALAEHVVGVFAAAGIDGAGAESSNENL